MKFPWGRSRVSLEYGWAGLTWCYLSFIPLQSNAIVSNDFFLGILGGGVRFGSPNPWPYFVGEAIVFPVVVGWAGLNCFSQFYFREFFPRNFWWAVLLARLSKPSPYLRPKHVTFRFPFPTLRAVVSTPDATHRILFPTSKIFTQCLDLVSRIQTHFW